MLMQAFDYINESYDLITNNHSFFEGINLMYTQNLGNWYYFLLFIPIIFILYIRTRNIGFVTVFLILGLSEGFFSQYIDLYVMPMFRIFLYLSLAVLLYILFKRD